MAPIKDDIRTSLDDAEFYRSKINEIVRLKSEHEQDVEEVRRYFRGYMHCWKAALELMREYKGMSKHRFSEWVKAQHPWETEHEKGLWKSLKHTRNYDSHRGAVTLKREIAHASPIAMFIPQIRRGNDYFPGQPVELISTCERGIAMAGKLLQNIV